MELLIQKCDINKLIVNSNSLNMDINEIKE